MQSPDASDAVQSPPPNSPPHRRIQAGAGLLLVVVCLATFFLALGKHDLWGPDEVRYALVAREMVEHHNLVVPHLNDAVYLEKPPLVFWATAFFARGLGLPYETAARLPAALAGLATVLLVWAYGTRRWNARVGLLAGVMLATSAHFFWFARSGMLDVPLTFFTTAATLAAVHALDAPRRWFAWVVVAGAAMAGAMLTKGPVGLLVPVLVAGPYGWAVRRRGRMAVGLTVAVALSLLAIVPWWLAALRESGGSYGSASELWRQTYGRAVTGFSHVRPFYYYVPHLIPTWLPWAVFLPGALWAAGKRFRTPAWEAWRLPVLWSIVPFIAFSLSAGKRDQYLLPLFPGMALMLALYLDQFAADRQPLARLKEVFYPTQVLAGVVCAAGVAIASSPLWAQPEYVAALQSPTAGIITTGVLVAAGGVVLGRYLARQPFRTALVAVAVGSVALFAGTAAFALPRVDQFKSARQFAAYLHDLHNGGTRILLFDSLRPDLAFYYHEHMNVVWPPANVAGVLAEEPGTVAVIRDRFYTPDPEAPPVQVLGTYSVGSKTWYVLRHAADTAAGPTPTRTEG